MSDDFFSVRPARSPTTDADSHNDFAHAISLRFGSADLRTARLLPEDLPQHHPKRSPQPPIPPPPPKRAPSPSPPQHPFYPLPPSSLTPYLDDPYTLILDIRPHAAHAAARINNAISLSVPTTLLKRPLFSLSKLSQMLPSPSSRARFANWPSASRILVYDSDSAFSPDNSIIAGLLRKFRAEGFTGELAWVRGGFQAVWREARHLATTDLPPPEQDDSDAASSSTTLRTSHLPKAAFSLLSTTAAPPPQPGTIPGTYLPNTPAPSASRAANPFFDTIRQNVELSHGITERIPLRLPRRVRRRIHDLPFPWLQVIAKRSALRHPSTSRHPGLDSLESGSESSDDPHTSDPDENDPNVEEGAEALAMQFYRIELAEQRRLRSIMEHHTKESELAVLASLPKPRRTLDKGSAGVSVDPAQGRTSVRTVAKSAPSTPHLPPFPFSITAGVEKGTKNRYTHIWPFEHARVRLHDGRHQGSHPGRRDKGRPFERGRSTRDRAGEQGKERGEQRREPDKLRRSRSSPAFGKGEDQQVPEVAAASSGYFFYSGARSSMNGASVGFGSRPAHLRLSPGPSVPQVKIEYDITEQDSRVSELSTPATALPLATPPFYTPMEISPAPTPMRARSPQVISLPSGISVNPVARLGSTQFSLPSFGPPPSFPLRLPNRPGGLLPSIGEQAQTSKLSFPSARSQYFPSGVGTVGETAVDTGVMRREPSPVDDYVNASYVQPLGTRKRYIATQGPLPSTFVDFWTLVWEQNVHVIVMLTREVENAMVKCGSYWTDTEYGPLRLELLFTSPSMSPSANAASADISKQGFFAIREPQEKTGPASRDQPTLITRTFALSHISYPGVPPRRITHLQYLDWSDMNVPDDPRGVLDLIKTIEQTVAESTPGPSPSGSLSPGSAGGSLGSQSPDVGSDRKGHDMSLLSPTSAGLMPGAGRRRRGSEWRHPELDSKTGVATFALGKVAPVLLHCSAGVGRTGGFIAVDAVLDGIRRELRKIKEERHLKKASRLSVVASTEGKTDLNDMDTSGEFSLESTEAGVNSMERSAKESSFDGIELMDVDEPTVDKAKETQDPLYMINTVPIPVSAGDRMKGRRRHHHHKAPSDGKLRSSSESLVVHVPYVGTDDMPEETSIAGIGLGDPKVAGWPSSSTREWVEQVSDQTHVHAKADRLPPPSRERSPGSASNSSGLSALNSADESLNGSVGANASGSASGSGNKVDRKSDMGSASGSGTDRRSGSGCPPPSLASKPGSGSISLSNSGSGTGTGSRLGSSLLRVRLWDSSATSISVESTDSLSPRLEPKPSASLPLPSVIHPSSSSDMQIDRPPRPISAPLQPTHPDTMVPRSKSMLGLSPVASLSSPILPRMSISSFDGDAPEGAASRPNSDAGSDASASPLQEFESGESVDGEWTGKNDQRLSDEVEGPSVPSKSRRNLRLNTELGPLRIPGAMHSSSSAKSPLPSFKGRERAATPQVPDDSASQQFLPAPGKSGAFEYDPRNADHPVIDYKLPRELHSDLSPPLISSFSEPICTVIQDMREQRMSLCQSLRQYVFVHAAIIEGALRIVDEERELWGSAGTNDDASSAEWEPEVRVGRRTGDSEGSKAWFGRTDKAEVAVITPDLEHGSFSHRTLSLHIPASSPSGISSPSKGKRGPSPTELLREDKTGALSLNKRPSIQRHTMHDENNQFLFESSRSSPVAGENEGPRDVGTCTTRPAPGRPAVPEMGGPTGSDRTIFG